MHRFSFLCKFQCILDFSLFVLRFCKYRHKFCVDFGGICVNFGVVWCGLKCGFEYGFVWNLRVSLQANLCVGIWCGVWLEFWLQTCNIDFCKKRNIQKALLINFHYFLRYFGFKPQYDKSMVKLETFLIFLLPQYDKLFVLCSKK